MNTFNIIETQFSKPYLNQQPPPVLYGALTELKNIDGYEDVGGYEKLTYIWYAHDRQSVLFPTHLAFSADFGNPDALELAAVEEHFDDVEIEIIKTYVTEILGWPFSIKELPLPVRPDFYPSGERLPLSAVEEFNCGKAAWHQRFGTAGFCELPFKLMAFGFGVWPHRAHDC